MSFQWFIQFIYIYVFNVKKKEQNNKKNNHFSKIIKIMLHKYAAYTNTTRTEFSQAGMRQ